MGLIQSTAGFTVLGEDEEDDDDDDDDEEEDDDDGLGLKILFASPFSVLDFLAVSASASSSGFLFFFWTSFEDTAFLISLSLSFWITTLHSKMLKAFFL